jgi:hypothetical protein
MKRREFLQAVGLTAAAGAIAEAGFASSDERHILGPSARR